MTSSPRIDSPLLTSVPLTQSRIETSESSNLKHNQVTQVVLYGIPIVALNLDSTERLCLAQISNTLLKDFSYNEIHNRRVALGITCVQCTPVQLEILRRAGAMPISSRRCGMISKREAERLCKSFLGDNSPPKLPENFAFDVIHECAWGSRGSFIPSRYNSSRAKCIKCLFCSLFFSPNKFVFHSHRFTENGKYVQPDAANFNSWRRHIQLYGDPPDEILHAWEDVKAMFNGGTRKRVLGSAGHGSSLGRSSKQLRVNSPITKPHLVPLVKGVSGDLNHSRYNPYISGINTLGGINPELTRCSYPVPMVQKTLEMRQSFVDYLWGSRSALPPIGFSYPLPWPKRPLPSLPPFSFTGVSSSLSDTQDVKDDLASSLLPQASFSAFSPVNRIPTPPSPPNSPSASSPILLKSGEEKYFVKANSSKVSGSRFQEEPAELPDSSKISDEESVDVEGSEENSSNSQESDVKRLEKLNDENEASGHHSWLSKKETFLFISHPEDLSPTSTKPEKVSASFLKREQFSPDSQKLEKFLPGIENSLKSNERLENSLASNQRLQNVLASNQRLESALASNFSPIDPFCLANEEDPRFKIFLLREMENRRRMEVEMARLKYSYQTSRMDETNLSPTIDTTTPLTLSHSDLNAKLND